MLSPENRAAEQETLASKNTPNKIIGKLTLMICGAALAVIGWKFSDHYKQYQIDKEELATIRFMDEDCKQLKSSFEELEKTDPNFLKQYPIYHHCMARLYWLDRTGQ
jgi:hypothetical protein